MRTTNLLVLALCAVCVVADIKFESLIIGGQNAEEGQFPYQISLRDKNDQHFCGGSILSNRFLLSAAHCTKKCSISNTHAVVGAVKRFNGGGVKVKLSAIVNHPDFSYSDRTNDISLLITADEIIFTNFIQPITLPTYDLSKEGVDVVVSGWGQTQNRKETRQSPDILQFAKTSAIGFDACIEQFKSNSNGKYVVKTHVCTQSPINVGACFGDSGGPLVDVSNPENKTLVGVVSWGVPCGLGYPDVYTRVYSFLDWINSEMVKFSRK